MGKDSLQVRIRTGIRQGLLVATYFCCAAIIPLVIAMLFVRIPWWQRGLLLMAGIAGQYAIGLLGGLFTAIMRGFLAGYPLFLTTGALFFAAISYGLRALFGLPMFSRGAPVSGTVVGVATTVAAGALIGAVMGSILWLMFRK